MEAGLIPSETTGINQRARKLPLPGPLSWFRLFLGASFFRMHPGSPGKPVLAAWRITTDDKPAFIGLAPAPGNRRTPGTTSSGISRTADCPPRCWSSAMARLA